MLTIIVWSHILCRWLIYRGRRASVSSQEMAVRDEEYGGVRTMKLGERMTWP